MLRILLSTLKGFFGTGHERTIKIKKNIIYSFLIKGLSVLVGYMLIPLTINYVNPTQYGIWVTIASLVAWINTFDIGLSNGLRNKLARSLALDEKEDAVKYISTTYAMLLLIAAAVFIIVAVAGSFFNWNQLLRIQGAISYDIWPVFVIALACFCIQFVLQPVTAILTAGHEPFKASLILLLGQVLTYVLIGVLIHYPGGSLYKLVIVVAGAPVFILLVSSLYLFGTGLKPLAPRLKQVDLKSAKGLLNIGAAFFFIQIGALVLYETDNIIITRTLGPLAVTDFNIAYKYFSILTIAFTIIITPYWSAFTDAYAKNDLGWIKLSIRKLRKIWGYVAVAAVLLYLISDTFYAMWIGDNKVSVSTQLSLAMAVYVVVQCWMVLHAYVLNGVGKLRLQLVLVIITGIINIPLSVFLIKQVGIAGTVVANILVILFMSIFLTRQCALILSNKAKGIWAR